MSSTGLAQALKRNVNNREVIAVITLPIGIFLLGLGVLGLAVVTAIHDTRWLRRKTEKTVDHQDSLREAA